MPGIETGLGGESAASTSINMEGQAIVVGMDALRKSIDTLNQTMNPEAADDTKTENDAMPDEAVAVRDAEVAEVDTSLLEALNEIVHDTTLVMTDFRDKLNAIVAGDSEGSEGGAGALGLLGGDSENAMGELGEEKLTPEEELAKEQEVSDASVAIEEDRKDKKKALGDVEKIDKKKKLEGIYNESMKAAKALGLSEKQTAIATTVVSTAKAIAKANEKGFPANIPLMAQAAAVGAAQLGVIKGQFHGGIDDVPNSGTYLLEKGERVVDRRLNADLKGYLGGQGGGSVSNKAGDNVSIANTVTMSFAEGTTEDQVYEAKMKFEEMLRDMYDEYATPNPFD